jgi:hypothetical protein
MKHDVGREIRLAQQFHPPQRRDIPVPLPPRIPLLGTLSHPAKVEQRTFRRTECPPQEFPLARCRKDLAAAKDELKLRIEPPAHMTFELLEILRDGGQKALLSLLRVFSDERNDLRTTIVLFEILQSRNLRPQRLRNADGDLFLEVETGCPRCRGIKGLGKQAFKPDKTIRMRQERKVAVKTPLSRAHEQNLCRRAALIGLQLVNQLLQLGR